MPSSFWFFQQPQAMLPRCNEFNHSPPPARASIASPHLLMCSQLNAIRLSQAIRAFDGEFPLDEVDNTLISDRSAPVIGEDAAMHLSIKSFNRGQLRPTSVDYLGVPVIPDVDVNLPPRPASTPVRIAPRGLRRATVHGNMLISDEVFRELSIDTPTLKGVPPPLHASMMSPATVLSGSDQMIVDKFQNLASFTKRVPAAQDPFATVVFENPAPRLS